MPKDKAAVPAPSVWGSEDIAAGYAAEGPESKRANKPPPRLRPWVFAPTFAAWPDSTTRR
ncbi:hypothetical protein LBMAG55_05140 [Verrucomicrobiota bacterium]|nr:hypothetical protein LBMAG55_05140 [Verrucomicrobiota bacterium]